MPPLPTLKPPVTFTCACQRSYLMPQGSGLPAGWKTRTVHKRDGGSYDIPICADCAEFGAEGVPREQPSLSPAENDRTHDSSSAINDEPVPMPTPAKTGYRLWQATLTFHTDKGVTESKAIIGACDPVEAIHNILPSIAADRRTELFSIHLTPAPLAALGPIMTGGGLDAVNRIINASPADRMMRPKRQVWPNMGMHG